MVGPDPGQKKTAPRGAQEATEAIMEHIKDENAKALKDEVMRKLFEGEQEHQRVNSMWGEAADRQCELLYNQLVRRTAKLWRENKLALSSRAKMVGIEDRQVLALCKALAEYLVRGQDWVEYDDEG